MEVRGTDTKDATISSFKKMGGLEFLDGSVGSEALSVSVDLIAVVVVQNVAFAAEVVRSIFEVVLGN